MLYRSCALESTALHKLDLLESRRSPRESVRNQFLWALLLWALLCHNRITTLRNSSNMFTLCKLDAGKGLVNGCSWAPTLVYAPSIVNGSKPVWNLFYSACEDVPSPSHPDPAHGKDKPGDGIVHAVSATDSIRGPYVDVPSPIVPGSGVIEPFSHSFTTWRLRNGTLSQSFCSCRVH